MIEPLPERWARLGLGIGALGTLAWLLWPSPNWRFEPEPAAAFGGALTVWTASELRSIFRRSAHPHDVDFIRELRSIITLDAIRYLEQQDFGATYRNDRLDWMWKIDFDSQATSYGPHDRVLARKFAAFQQKLREFSTLLASNGGPIGASPHLASIVPDRERTLDEFSEKTWDLVRRANVTADEIVQRFEELMRVSRRRVPDAFGSAKR